MLDSRPRPASGSAGSPKALELLGEEFPFESRQLLMRDRVPVSVVFNANMHELGLSQHAEVPGNGWAAHIEFSCDITHRTLAAPKHRKNGSTSRVRDRTKNLFSRSRHLLAAHEQLHGFPIAFRVREV